MRIRSSYMINLRRNNGLVFTGIRYFGSNIPTSPLNKKEFKFPDLVVGMECSQSRAGYSILKFDDLSPVKFGLIDLSGLSDYHEAAAEIAGVMRVLKSEQDEAFNKKLTWSFGMREHMRIPADSIEYKKRKKLMELQGVVGFALNQMFQSKPIPVSPGQYLRFMDIQSDVDAGRAKIFEAAVANVPDFPVVNREDGRFSRRTFLMSDAWAIAHYTQRLVRVEAMEKDSKFKELLEIKVGKDKRLCQIKQSLDNMKFSSSDSRDLTIERELRETLRTRMTKLSNDLAWQTILKEDDYHKLPS